jgi:hypothetical protein
VGRVDPESPQLPSRNLALELLGSTTSYVVLVTAIIFVNSRVMSGLELPWIAYAAIWAVMFAPALVVTVFAAISTGLGGRRLLLMYVVALTSTMFALETLFIIDVRWHTALLAVMSLSCAIWLLFKSADSHAFWA